MKPYKKELDNEKDETIKPFKEESSEVLDTSLDFDELEKKDAKIKKSIGFLGSLGSVFVGLFSFVFLAVVASTVGSIQEVLNTKEISEYIYLGGLSILFISLLLFTIENIKEFLSLQKVTKLKEEFNFQAKKPDANIIPLAHLLINKYKDSSYEELKKSVLLLQKNLNSSLVYQDIYDTLDKKVLGSIDEISKTTIHKASVQGALTTAISPVPIIDMALVLWRSVVLTKQIASLYGFKPGIITTTTLLKRGMVNIMFAGVTELVHEFTNQALGSSFLAKASTSLGQGAINGVLIARLGYGVMEACRPIESDTKKDNFFKMVFKSIQEKLGK